MPLTLLSFNATLQDKTVQLTWQTANEINTAHFITERSIEGTNFSPVGKVNAKGSNGLTNYNHVDDISRVSSNKIYYRLRQEDRDGSVTYSKIVVINVPEREAGFTISPNPATSYFTINLHENISIAKATLVIRNMEGQTLMKQKISASRQTVNIYAFPKGVYVVTVFSGDKTYQQKLLVE